MKKIQVKTGYGYFKDRQGRIVAKANLPPGEHPVKDDYEYVEVTKEEFENIKVSPEPQTEEYLKEMKIKKEMFRILREMAIKNLKEKGEL